MRKILISLSLACMVIAGLSFASSASAATNYAPATLCEHNQHYRVTDGTWRQYLLRNPYWKGTGTQCIRSNGSTGFTVTRVAHNGHGQVVGFPAIMRGCYWNACTPDSRLPIRVSHIHHAASTWRTVQRASGTYDSSYDIWFGKHYQTQGHADGAELMIFTNTHGGCCFKRDAAKVHIGKQWYWLMHWYRCDSGNWGNACWNYIQFRRMHYSWKVHVNIKRFIEVCEHRGLIRPSWFMENLQAGFELWSGGRGLQTKHFSATVW